MSEVLQDKSRLTADLPEGFFYRADFLPVPEEQNLLRHLRKIDFSPIKMRGVVARRKAAHFGWLYGYESWRIEPGPPIPEFLLSLRDEAARLGQVESDQLVEALITEYPAGAGIGWHRDAPVFGIVVAISLRSACRFRFRYGPRQDEHASLIIEPRSAYVLAVEARNRWQHSISPAPALRYSITFRTLRTASEKRIRLT